MTLIELTVVLLVLIGLAGLMIPYVISFVSKTHDSTGSNNLAQLNGAIIRYENSVGVHPANFESLVEQAGGTVYGDLMRTNLFSVLSLNTNQFTSLNAAGITDLFEMSDSSANESATFDSTVNSSTALAVGVNVAEVAAGGTADQAAHMLEAFGRHFDVGCYTYVALGIGAQSDLIGQTITDAPVHFANNQKNMGPDDKYNRFVAVYQVDNSDSTGNSLVDGVTGAACTERVEDAKFVGAAMAMGMGHMFGLNHSLLHSYENLNDELSGS